VHVLLVQKSLKKLRGAHFEPQVQRPANTTFWWGFFSGYSPPESSSPRCYFGLVNDSCVVFNLLVILVEFSFCGFAGAAHLYPLRKSLPDGYVPGP
jgi:hypothetical protein